MQCKEWDDANSELFKEPHDEAVHKNSYKSKLYELISASLECHWHIYPRTPFATTWRSPQGDTRKIEALFFCRPTELSGVAKELESLQRTGFVGEPKRPENPVSR